MGRTTHPMAILLYCIRYPVKPFLAPPSGFLLLRPRILCCAPEYSPHSHRASVSFNPTFSHRSITGRIKSDSQKLESSDQPLSPIRQEPPRPGKRCARANRRAISRPSNLLLRLFASHSAIRARRAAISDQAAHRCPRRILQPRRRLPNRN